MKRYIKISFGLGILALMLTPFAVDAAIVNCTGALNPTLCNLLDGITSIINIAIGILASLALLVFFFGLVKFIIKAGDPKEKEAGRTLMTYGVIALFVMFSVFGIVRFLQRAVGINETNQGNNQGLPPPTIPAFNNR